MLHVVDKYNRHMYEKPLEESFRIRHEIYAEGRNWKAIQRPDRRDVDQFDNDDAIYLLLIEGRERKVVGGSRLVSTLKPHLMSEVFPTLANQRPLPRSATIFEWTRYFVVPEMREGHRACFASGVILCGLQEWCLEEGVERLSIVLEPYWLPRFQQLGLNPQPLGLPIASEDGPILGITIDISEETLERTRRIRGIEGPVLIHGRSSQDRRNRRVTLTSH